MKNLLFGLIYIISVPTILSAQRFEGKITMKAIESEPMDVFIKQDRIRLEIKADEGLLVLLYGAKDPMVVAIMHGTKQYAEIPVKLIDPDEEPASENILKKTDERRNIHGLACEKWIVEDKGLTTVIWMTKELGISWAELISPVTRVSIPKWKHDLENYFPVEVIQTNKKKTEKIIEVVALEKMAVADDLFSLPPGFQKMGN